MAYFIDSFPAGYFRISNHHSNEATLINHLWPGATSDDLFTFNFVVHGTKPLNATQGPMIQIKELYTLPETNSEVAPENGWQRKMSFRFGCRPISRCELLVSGRVPEFFHLIVETQIKA